ncbi:GTP-dependent dephospho-CoA kinase family protein [Halorubrum sp. DTA46]|uniref:GTP-dependent dephospho-CoA kinase family protein n=1 Tax=Halorubrum sp. DTA46 TaxID=3402162 RepID=UPI003AAE1E17
MLTLPDSLRDAFKEPLGPVTTDTEELLAAAAETRGSRAARDAPVVAVGDVVTYHLREAGRVPDVALIDGKTEREAVRSEIESALATADVRRIAVESPPASLSADLLRAIGSALSASEPVMIVVDGEEDLAALPAIVAAPDGATVVYGQPGEGMVRVAVTPESRAEARELFEALDGDVDGAYELLGTPADDDS